MAQVQQFDITTLPWNDILAEVHQYYEEILESEFGDNEEVLALLRDAQIGVQYNPDLVGQEPSPEQEAYSFWDRAGAQISRIMQDILKERYTVPPEYAAAVEVGEIGVVFHSPHVASEACCTEWHECGTGRLRSTCCPC